MSDDASPLSSEQREILSRREFLKRAGRYSAAAAALFASSTLFPGCPGIFGYGGSSFAKAKTGTLGAEETVTLTEDRSVMYYSFAFPAAGNYVVAMSPTSDSTLPITVSLFDSAESSIGSLEYSSGSFTLLSMAIAEYVLLFERNPGGDATFTFRIDAETSYSDSSYSDSSYSDSSYSDSSYSDYSDYSDYSRYSDSYSDWSNYYGDWSNAW